MDEGRARVAQSGRGGARTQAPVSTRSARSPLVSRNPATRSPVLARSWTAPSSPSTSGAEARRAWPHGRRSGTLRSGLASVSRVFLVRAAPAGRIGGSRTSRRPRVTLSGSLSRCQRSAWSDSAASTAYRWRGSTSRAGTAGRGSTVVLTRRLDGRAVVCSVTATNSAGSAMATAPRSRSIGLSGTAAGRGRK
jgi:hypothetical protein